jgi:DUF1680 family protein
MNRDQRLLAQMDDVIAVIAKAQQPDGYLATQITVRAWPRFEKRENHELYVMGHLISAACAHRRITGKTDLLDVATRCADYLHKTFSDPAQDPVLANCPMNPSIIMAAVELYRTTGERRYLDLAQIIVNNRGSRTKERSQRNERGILKGGSELNQDRVPLRQENQVIGHAVFFTYLYAGAADVYMETGDKTLLAALDRLWTDLVTRKMYVTGGVCAIHNAHPARALKPGAISQIANDTVHEAAGMPYELPNSTGYNETCGQIGNLMWNWRMLQITGQAKFADVMELNLYNSILSGINVSGKGWSYTNPLRWHGPEHPLMSQDAHRRFDPGRIHVCCPSSLLRTVAGWHGCLYSTSPEGFWVHHYGGSRFEGTLADGRSVRVIQQTDYPWDGKVSLTIEAMEGNSPSTIAVRIPEWASAAKLSVNGQPVEGPLTPSTYAKIRRAWRAGDVLELDLPMPVRLLDADPRVESARNQAAVKRGPIVYCLEEADLPAGISFDSVRLPRDARWTVRHDPSLLGGITVLETEGRATAGEFPANRLYADLRSGESKPVTLRLIPYYAWNNRGESRMSVWVPLD